MSRLTFDRTTSSAELLRSDGSSLAGPFPAANNVDSRSKGPWPDGTYRFQTHLAHAEVSDPDSEYGSFGILIFLVPGRTGMGVHSGRRNIPDGRRRAGPKHCTLGCVRTTDAAMQAFLGAISNDALLDIVVSTPRALLAAVAHTAKQARPKQRPAKKRISAPKVKAANRRRKQSSPRPR